MQENIPLNEDKVMCCQVSQNVVQEIRQEVTRQVLAELTIKNLDESDESDGREVCTLKQFERIAMYDLLLLIVVIVVILKFYDR